MSVWAYVNGSIYVTAAGRTSAETRYILETVLDHLPRVSGSERDMKVFITSSDYCWGSQPWDEFGLQTDKANIRHGIDMETNEKYILTLDGFLCDREFRETVREFMNWLCRLAKRVYINDLCVKVHDKCGNKLVLTDPDPFSAMAEAPSSMDWHGESAWWEYLMWEREPFSGRPLWHAYKYGHDPRIIEEVERRRKWHEEMDQNPLPDVIV